jgi:glycosyltransferase involved in cell wall biosynthesis
MVIHDLAGTGGMERVHTEILRRAADRVDFTVISVTLDPALRGLVQWRRVPVIRRPVPLKFLLFFLGAALQVARTRADIVHTAGAIIPNRVTMATVHFCHASFRQAEGRLAAPDAPMFRRLNDAIGRFLSLQAERWCYRPGRTRALVAVSANIRRQLLGHYPRVPVYLTPNGVDARRFSPEPNARRHLRQAAGIDHAAVVILFVGGYWHLKGLDLAIRGLALAQPQIMERLTLWIVGAGDQRRYQSMAIDAGIADRVRFFGPRSDVERFYQAADLLVLPSRYEAFSLVAFEAAACGLPVVATQVGCIEELLGPTQVAGVVIERTAEAVAGAIARLAPDPSLRTRMGLAGRQRAQEYSWDRTVDRVVTLYQQLLASRPSSSPVRSTR